MADFLLELRSEEIPARMQAGARADLEKLFRAAMDKWGVRVGQVTVWSTPRRLALIAHRLPAKTEPVREETKGPRTSAPQQAVEGFLRKTGLTKSQLVERDGVWFAVKDVPGFAMKEVLENAVFSVIWDFPWPKSMRWGEPSRNMNSLRWVRPLSGIVAILDDELVDVNIDGIQSSYMTKGHRFHHPDEIRITNAFGYAAALKSAYVLVNHEERENIVRSGAYEAANRAGLKLVEDEGLVIENAGLTEWPVPLLGRFDEAFLDVPPEVIQLTARVNQKYFVCTGAPAQAGASRGSAQPGEVPASAGTQELANAFVCTANIEASDGGAEIVAGNRKVLAARLSDARFFWEQDLKTPLADQAKKLGRITFHEKLGTVADKVERVAKLARWLVEEGIVGTRAPAQAGASRGGAESGQVPAFAGTRDELADMAEQAARLCKADLVTEMVGEFPELQGLMGGYYARAEGLPVEVADAIRDHYKPVGQGDEVPTAPVTVAVSLADKLDTLTSFFAIDEKPTGSKDPFALRRAALGVIRLLENNGVRLSLSTVRPEPVEGQAVASDAAIEGRKNGASTSSARTDFGLLDFFADRLKVQQREAGVRHDLIDAVFALGGEDDLVRLLARVHALQAFMATEDGANLLAGYKRAANILRKEGWQDPAQRIARTGGEDPMENVDDPQMRAIYAERLTAQNALSYAPEPAEKALIDSLGVAGPKAADAVASEDFAGAMAALASLRSPIDAFFDSVTVNDPHADKRAARLGLLAAFRAAVHNVADFSRIEG